MWDIVPDCLGERNRGFGLSERHVDRGGHGEYHDRLQARQAGDLGGSDRELR